MDRESILAEAKDKYAQALESGELSLAVAATETALSMGAQRADIYLEVLAPSQVRLGELWHEGVINVAQEHLATSITLEVMDRLRRDARPSTRLGLRAVVTPVEGDPHWIGARMIADFLEMDGWDVDFLGAGTPAGDLAEHVRQRDVDLVALSATQPDSLPRAAAAAHAIRELNGPAPKVLLGGRALGGSARGVESTACSAIAGDAAQALDEARRLVGLTERRVSLDELLIAMGQMIRAARTDMGMTQQELAKSSDLDRTYISQVERGRQNVSIGAALRIAHALDVPIGALLAQSSPVLRETRRAPSGES